MAATLQWQLDRRPLTSLLWTCRLSTPQVGAWKLWSIWCQKKDANDKAASLPPRSSHAAGSLLHSLTAACCVCACFYISALTDCAVCSRPVVMTSKSAGLSVRCTSPWVWLPGGACIVSAGAKSITRRLYLQSNFIPPATRGGLSSEPCLAFKCGKSAQSPPLTRNAARLSSWCSLNKLNNEGISEMPKRHYTPTIRARSE